MLQHERLTAIILCQSTLRGDVSLTAEQVCSGKACVSSISLGYHCFFVKQYFRALAAKLRAWVHDLLGDLANIEIWRAGRIDPCGHHRSGIDARIVWTSLCKHRQIVKATDSWLHSCKFVSKI